MPAVENRLRQLCFQDETKVGPRPVAVAQHVETGGTNCEQHLPHRTTWSRAHVQGGSLAEPASQ